MKKVLMFLMLILFGLASFGQSEFKITGKAPSTVTVAKGFESTTTYPFTRFNNIYGISISANATFTSNDSYARVILVDKNFNQYLVYETSSLLELENNAVIDNLCQETAVLDKISPREILIELKDATLYINNFTVTLQPDPSVNINNLKKERKSAQDDYKINKLNKTLGIKGQLWIAGHTEVSRMTYAERKKLYGDSQIPIGFEYYVGGIFSYGNSQKALESTTMVENWDWRNRHGINWITSIKNQSGCGSCWAFAATGAVEAQVNLYFNQSLNLDLSEQDLLSCSGAGSCSGGYPSTALQYVATTGQVDEQAFPYTATDQMCNNKSKTPTQLIKIAGRIDMRTTAFPNTNDDIKKKIIQYGPLSGGLYDWSHALTLVGWHTVKEGDRFYTRDLNTVTYWITVPAGSPLIGKTVWIFKNSWGQYWGDQGYVYVETLVSNFGWTHALLSPVQSLIQPYTVQCVDRDGDGYYWWGIGARPESCPNQNPEDGDDSNAAFGPLDQYGNCIKIGEMIPTADFIANKTVIDEGMSVTFTDKSLNYPETWSWTFDGGTPATSTLTNPTVTYSAPGVYTVSLTVTNVDGTDTEIKVNYITVKDIIPTYCTTSGYVNKDYIQSIMLQYEVYNSGSSGYIGYRYFPATSWDLQQGKTYPMKLTPSGYVKGITALYWCVWIDYNNNLDFNDPGELVYTGSRVKGIIDFNLSIPLNTTVGWTRMRVSMKRNGLPPVCGAYTNGEVEDYDIQLLPAVPISLSSEQMNLDEIKIYPNPTSDKLYVLHNNIDDQTYYYVYNIFGSQVSFGQIKTSITEVDMKKFESGIYILSIKGKNINFNKKFIKE